MIVVSLIGILSAIGLNVINVTKVQQRARDSRRIGDVKKIQTALELYFSDNRQYPVSGTFAEITTANFDGDPYSDLTPYMSEFPADPLKGIKSTSGDTNMKCRGSDQKYGYYLKTDGSGSLYIIDVIMETTENAAKSPCSSLPSCASLSCDSAGAYCYCVQNPM